MPLSPALPEIFRSYADQYKPLSDIVGERNLLGALEKRIAKHNGTPNEINTLWQRFGFNVFMAAISGSKSGIEAIDACQQTNPHRFFRSLFEFNEFSEVFSRLYKASGYSTKVGGQIASCAKNDFGFAPLAHEMSVAYNLSKTGLAVNFTDLGDEERFDFLIGADDMSISVDCKCILSDTGFPISNPCLDSTHSELLPLFKDRRDVFEKTIIIVDITRRISQPAEITSLFRKFVGDGAPYDTFIAGENARLLISKFDSNQSGLHAATDLKKYFTDRIHHDFGVRMYTGFLPDLDGIEIGVPVICVCNEKSWRSAYDRMLEELKRDAEKQLSKQEYAILAIRFSEMSALQEDDAFSDKPEVPMQHMLAVELFKSKRAGHLAGVAFVGNPRYRQAILLGPNGEHPTLGQRHFRWFTNPSHSGAQKMAKAIGWS